MPARTLTKTTANAVIRHVKGGNTARAAFAAAGVDAVWLDWSRRAQKGDEPYADLFKRIKQAEAEVEAMCVNTVVKAARRGSSPAALAWLERRRPDEWRKAKAEDDKPKSSGPTDEFAEADELESRRSGRRA